MTPVTVQPVFIDSPARNGDGCAYVAKHGDKFFFGVDCVSGVTGRDVEVSEAFYDAFVREFAHKKADAPAIADVAVPEVVAPAAPLFDLSYLGLSKTSGPWKGGAA